MRQEGDHILEGSSLLAPTQGKWVLQPSLEETEAGAGSAREQERHLGSSIPRGGLLSAPLKSHFQRHRTDPNLGSVVSGHFHKHNSDFLQSVGLCSSRES